MIGERTKALFKLWGTGLANRPKTLNTMESFCSHLDKMFPGVFDLTTEGNICSAHGLDGFFTVVEEMAGNAAGDTRSALRSLLEFIQWLNDEGKSGAPFGELFAQLEQASRYTFRESFRDFFGAFNINQEMLIDYAMNPNVSYFASTEAAIASWHDLTGKLLNDQEITVRYENELFRLFYGQVFNNEHVVGDGDGNTEPINALSAVTGVTTREGSQNLLVNYKLSHIYARPNNPLMFSGVYNVAFTPTLIDAFTEEAEGEFAIRFRHVFREFAHQRFNQIYLWFKEFVERYNVHAQIDAFNPPGCTQRQLSNFRRKAHEEWSPIFEIPD